MKKVIMSFFIVLGLSAAVSVETKATTISANNQENYYVVTSENESYIITKSELEESSDIKQALPSQISYTLENGTLTISGTGEIQSNDDVCNKNLPWNLNKDEITSVIINEGITKIGAFAFIEYKNLKSVSFPNSLRAIGQQAFSYCPKLENINIPDNVSFLDAWVFLHDTALKRVSIGGNKEIGSFVCGCEPFGECTALEEITVSSNNIGLTSIDGVLYTKDKTTLIQYPGGKKNTTYVVCEKTKDIFAYSFRNSQCIEEVVLPSKLATIGTYAFESCPKLKNLEIPESVTDIADDICFDDISLDYINNKSQATCKLIGKPVYVAVWTDKDGNQISEFKNSVAYQHRVVTKLEVQNEIILKCGESLKLPCMIECQPYNNLAHMMAKYEDLLIVSSDPKVVSVSDDGTIKANDTASGVVTLYLSNKYSQPSYAPVSATCTVKVGTSTCNHTWNEGVIQSYPTYTSAGLKLYTCTKCFEISSEEMDALPMPESGSKLMSGKDMYKITKQADTSAKNGTVEFIKTTSKSSTITIPKTVKVDGITYKVTSVGKNALKGNKKVTKVVIGSNITSIGKNAFYGCTKLKKVSLPSKLTKISDSMFRDCRSLTSITIPSKVTTIEKNAFYGCKKLRTIKVKSTKIKKVGKNAFKNINSKAQIKVPAKKYKSYKKIFKRKGQGTKVSITKVK